MSWNLSTGCAKELLSRRPSSQVTRLGTNITINTGSIDQTGIGTAIVAGSFVTVFSANNDGVVAQVLSATADNIVVAAGTFTADSSGTAMAVLVLDTGSFLGLFENSQLWLFNGTRPTNADLTEGATVLAKVTRDGGAFVTDAPGNGLNLGQFAAGELKRALDANTTETEVWEGDGLVTDTAIWGRWYANGADPTTGASSSDVRMDGNITTSAGGDIVMATGRAIEIGVPAVVTGVTITAEGV